MSRVYFHIDLNAFFANAEVLLDPSLKGKPLAVSGNTRRSVVSTASYEARKYGVHSAMPIGQAKQLCRDLIVVPGHYKYYQELSHLFINIIHSYTDQIEQASIDECYADMTEKIMTYARPLDLAWEIQRRVKQEVGIPCSIGVAPNMFLAKMASDMKKPMGITVLRIRDVPQILWPLPISDMRGVGRRTLPLMEEMNIKTIGDLANYKNKDELRQIFGKNTDDIIAKANGHDNRTLVTEWDPKSVGVSETMLEDVTDYEELRGLIRTLSRRLSARMVKEHKAGRHLSLRICYYDFRNTDKSRKLEKSIWSADDIFVQAMQLFDDSWDDDEPVRLLGISVSDFISDTASVQMDLFHIQEAQKKETRDVLQDLNRQLGKTAFVRASSLLKEKNHGA